MKYIEVSQKINLTKEASLDDVKQALLERLRSSFDVKSLTDTDKGFRIEGTTSSGMGGVRSASVKLDITVEKNQEIVRIIIQGGSYMARSLIATYSALFFLVLLAGLLPGSIETSWEDSGATDALVFLIFGIFIFYDINSKLSEPEMFLQNVLKSLNTEFG